MHLVVTFVGKLTQPNQLRNSFIV